MAKPYTIQLDGVGVGPDVAVRVIRAPHPTEVSPHDHVFHEIVLIETGTVEHETVAGKARLRPGDLIVIQPRVWHAYRSPRGLSIINCFFDARLLHRFAHLLETVDGALELFRRRTLHPERHPPVVLHAGPADRAAMLQRFEGIMAEQQAGRPGWKAAAMIGLLEVLLATARLREPMSSEPKPHLAARTEQAVFDTVTHLEEHYTRPVHLNDLARRVHLSPAHLSRGFTKRMGMGVVEFVKCLRIEEACRQLHGTDAPIGEIANRVGYNEIAYFSRSFRGQTGQSPRAFRQARRAVTPVIQQP